MPVLRSSLAHRSDKLLIIVTIPTKERIRTNEGSFVWFFIHFVSSLVPNVARDPPIYLLGLVACTMFCESNKHSNVLLERLQTLMRPIIYLHKDKLLAKSSVLLQRLTFRWMSLFKQLRHAIPRSRRSDDCFCEHDVCIDSMQSWVLYAISSSILFRSFIESSEPTNAHHSLLL